jgi:hypothetical protein
MKLARSYLKYVLKACLKRQLYQNADAQISDAALNTFVRYPVHIAV